MNILLKAISGPYFFLIVQFISLVAKLYTLKILLQQHSRCASANTAWRLITIALASTAFESVIWIVKLCSITGLLSIPYPWLLMSIRLAWAISVIYYQSLILFFQQLIKRNTTLNIIDKISLTIASCLVLYFLGLAFFDFSTTTMEERIASMAHNPLELYLMQFSAFFGFLSVAAHTYLIVKNFKNTSVPRILRLQLKLFALYFITPYLVTQLTTHLQFIAHIHHIFALFEQRLRLEDLFYYLFSSIYTLLLTFGLLYCIRKVMGLRFLNNHHQVKSFEGLSFINDFTLVLRQLSLVTELKELEHTVQRFFKDAFNIPLTRVSLYIRPSIGDESEDDPQYNLIEQAIEHFLGPREKEPDFNTFLEQNNVFIYDELSFSTFYDKNKNQAAILQLLDAIKADILIPIYNRSTLLAYVIVERDARPHELYTDIEQHEMAALSYYLSSVITLLKSRSITSVLEQEHAMDTQLAYKDREVVHYREGMRSFLYTAQERKIGILFYRNRRFVVANQAAHDLLRINVNTQIGHPISKALKQIARRVEDTKSPYSIMTKDVKGKRIVLTGLPSLEQSYVIITVYYPEITDLLARQSDAVRESSDWDYLLYLSTTQTGKLINQFIPADSPKLLEFKIQLFRQSLKAKVVALHMHEKDVLPTVEIIQHITQSSAIHTITLTKPCTTIDVAVSIFGLNPLFGTQKETPALEQLSNNGTLFINNIQYLDKEAQEYLAEYLRFGLYRIFKSDRRVTSNARIICSTPVSLEDLVKEGKVTKNLYEQLKPYQLTFPPLNTLSDQELQELAVGYSEQAIVSTTFKNLLDLTETDIERFLVRRPSSLQEIKEYIHRLLHNKTEKHQLNQENHFDPAFGIADPKLAEAARLGKRALRHPDIMNMLWKKFKNQNKIAMFLGVNRSSVNRRCRKYKLDKPTKGDKDEIY